MMQSRSKGAAQLSQLSQFLWPLRDGRRLPHRMMQSTPSREICLPRDRCSDGPHLHICAASFFRHIKQKLAAAQINGSCPSAHTEDSLLAKTRDRLILKSQLTPGLVTSLHRRALAHIIVYCSRMR